MRFRVMLLLAFSGLGASARAANDDAGLAFFRDLAATQNYTLGQPTSVQITPDGKHAIFLRSGPRDSARRLYEFDIATGKERELVTTAQLQGNPTATLSAADRAGQSNQRESSAGFTSFQYSPESERLLVTLAGKIYVIVRETLAVITLPGSGWSEARFSPDGNFVAAAGSDRELHVIDLGISQPGRTAVTERAITQGATATLSHGRAEFVARQEMHRQEGYWWSPDSQRLLVQQTDEAKVEVHETTDPLRPEIPPAKVFRPRAGNANASVRLFLISRDGGKPLLVEWDNVAYPYLAHANWPASGSLTILVQNREQTEQRLLVVDPETGFTEDLVRQTDSAWVSLDPNDSSRRPPLWLEEGQQFLWTTQHRGAWQIEARRANGELVREITPLNFHVHTLIGVDEVTGTVWVRGGRDPRSTEIWTFPLSGGAGEVFTRGPGSHDAHFFPAPEMLVQTVDAFDGTWRTEIIDANAKVCAVIRSVAEAPARWPRTELTRTSGPIAFDAALTRPGNFAAGRKYPVLLHVYAGPTAKFVTANRRDYFIDQWFADRGSVVVRIDGRGTPGHGREWERANKGNFITPALDDQIAGLQALAKQFPELDLSRVGIMGESFGGYFAAAAVAQQPDIFRAAAVVAPVVAWENENTHFTERYLGLPQTAVGAYRASNLATYAARLSRPLLLMSGRTDEGVRVQDGTQFAKALTTVGKAGDLLPGLKPHHAPWPGDPAMAWRRHMRIAEFFERELTAGGR